MWMRKRARSASLTLPMKKKMSLEEISSILKAIWPPIWVSRIPRVQVLDLKPPKASLWMRASKTRRVSCRASLLSPDVSEAPEASDEPEAFDEPEASEESEVPEKLDEPEPVETAESPVEVSPETLVAEDAPTKDGEDFGFDLAAELSESFDQDPDASGSGTTGAGGRGGTSGDGFASVFAEFKKGVSETLSEGDHQAHYDLGIAYREMGLLNDAITELRLAMIDPRAPCRLSPSDGDVRQRDGRARTGHRSPHGSTGIEGHVGRHRVRPQVGSR